MNKLAVILAVLVLMSSFAVISWAGENSASSTMTPWQKFSSDVLGYFSLPSSVFINENTGQDPKAELPKSWLFDFGWQRFFSSHTSYEIGNPDEPYEKPLSRLEFPMNTSWLDFRVRRTCPRWSIGGRASFNVSDRSDGKMKDWDWETIGDADYLTTYSEGYCHVKQAFMFRGDIDMNIADWLRLPSFVEIRPLVGFQFQHLSFIDRDGTQWDYIDGTTDEHERHSSPLDGDSIEFRQDYYSGLIGLRGACNWDLNKYLTLKIHGEGDWGPTFGSNVDHHIKREGDLYGYIKSWGNTLYFATGFDVTFLKTISAGLTFDYLWIRTTGQISHINEPLDDYWKWKDGVKVFSDQFSLITHVSLAF